MTLNHAKSVYVDLAYSEQKVEKLQHDVDDAEVHDADIYRTMRKVGDHGGMVNLYAENGVAIQVLIEEALAAGNVSPKYHQRSYSSSDPHRGAGRSACLH
jgi:hypothetical protein